MFFGATVRYANAAGTERVVSIVGIDEVDLDRHYISWVSPLARALMKSGPGDRVVLHAPGGTEHLEILDVRYERIPVEPFREPPGAESTGKERARYGELAARHATGRLRADLAFGGFPAFNSSSVAACRCSSAIDVFSFFKPPALKSI